MSRILSLLLVFVLVVSCYGQAPGGPFPTPALDKAVCHGEVSGVFHVDSEFTPAELAQLQRASDDWALLSSGQINMVVARSQGVPHIHRTVSSSTTVMDEESKQTLRRGTPFFTDGWSTDDGEIYLVVDRVSIESLHVLASHEMGHSIGLRWANCDTSIYDCIHTDDPQSVMYPQFNPAQQMNHTDLTLCRSSCLCP